MIKSLDVNKDGSVTKTELMHHIYAQILPPISESAQDSVAKTFGALKKRMNPTEFQKVFPVGGSVTQKVFDSFKGQDGLVDASSIAKYYAMNLVKHYKRIVLNSF